MAKDSVKLSRKESDVNFTDKPKKTAPDILEEASKTFAERHKLYGPNYRKFGRVMTSMFPNGLELKTEDDFNRFNMFTQVVGKMTRYGECMTRGGHQDSAHDAIVYSAMLEEMTDGEIQG